MNRFFRTAYSATLVYLCLTLFGVLFTGVGMPFPAFSCLYFGLLFFLMPCILQRQNGKEWPFYVLGAVTAASGFIPIALAHCPVSHWLIHLFGIAASAVFLSSLRYRTTHDYFLAKFEFSVIVLLVLIGFVNFIMRADFYESSRIAQRTEAVNLAMNCIVPCAIVMLVSGVLLLRGLRAQLGRVDEKVFNRRQLRDTVIFAILVTLVFAVDPFLWLGKAVSFLLNEVLRPSFNFLARLLASMLGPLSLRSVGTENRVPTDEEPHASGSMPAAELAETETVREYIEESTPALTADHFFLAAAALALLCIFVWQICKLARNRRRGRNRGHGYPNETYEALPAKKGRRRKDRPAGSSRDPRERIRYLYGEFLRHLAKRRVKAGETDTCGEIRQRAESLSVADPPTLSGLTALYEEARYRLEEMPAEDDARKMKDLLEKVRKNG